MQNKKALTLKINPVREEFDLDRESGGMAKPEEGAEIKMVGDYKLFEIENHLRQICFDTYEPLRQRILKESQAGKEARKLAKDAMDLVTTANTNLNKMKDQMKYLDALDRKFDIPSKE
jgi:hypothetical protein